MTQRDKKSRWQSARVGAVIHGYSSMAFLVGAAQLIVFRSFHYSIVPPVILVSLLGLYTLGKMFFPSRWYTVSKAGHSLLTLDILVCIFLVLSTGGLYSPFLLYSLAPVLTSALFLQGKVTFIIAGITALQVIGSHAANPFFPTQLSVPEMSYFTVFVIALTLAAILPYMSNANIRHKDRAEGIIEERHRLSREIHDSTAQTISALRWHVQLLRRSLEKTGIPLDEITEVENLVEKANRDTRESLVLLRNGDGNGTFLSRLNGFLEQFKADTGLDFQLNAPASTPHLEALVELELLRICQEALMNIRRHAGAHLVQVNVRPSGGSLRVDVIDDGCGFDMTASHQHNASSRGHGLDVMRERAESIGGKFRVTSVPGRGTEVHVEMPASSISHGVLLHK